MRILLTGILVFVIWTILSTWLYVNKIRPATQDVPIAEQQVPKPEPVNQADPIEEVTPKKIPDDLVFYFDFDDADVHASSLNDDNIKDFKTWIMENDSVKLSITGHTDNKGTDEYNMKLGMRRANSTMHYLAGIEINAEMITSSKGESQPVADQSTEEGRAKNRRAVVTIKK